MDLLQSIVLGIVQGITEFLPISSTAHLALVPWFFSWKDPGLAFDMALHIGTLLAVVYYFWRDFLMIAQDFVRALFSKSFRNHPNGKTGLFIIIATIPGALAGLIFEEQAAGILRHPLAIAFSVFFFGIVLYLTDRFSVKEKEVSEMGICDCLIIGVAQALAIIPGVSRSGASIAGALVRNFRRDEAARFSFLLSTPLIFGAILLESRHIEYSTVLSTPFLAGILASATFGFLSIKYLIRYVQTKSYNVFVVYRILLAAFIVLLYLGKSFVEAPIYILK
ncbi:MAG TPA: undecaprenyl-diphosphate phosphatase [Thermodesulfobacteriota bacterium]|nr:undecaprenyl-diphosphate phosphatase [Thermodesulfobacteriota bacterium]